MDTHPPTQPHLESRPHDFAMRPSQATAALTVVGFLLLTTNNQFARKQQSAGMELSNHVVPPKNPNPNLLSIHEYMGDFLEVYTSMFSSDVLGTAPQVAMQSTAKSKCHPLHFADGNKSFPLLSQYFSDHKQTALLQRQIAERFWLQQQGVIYMQHSRKAGGTTLCMLLRMNRRGLVFDDRHPLERKTCQLVDFCVDSCDLPARIKSWGPNFGVDMFDDFASYPQLLHCVMSVYGRNFIEIEGEICARSSLPHTHPHTHTISSHNCLFYLQAPFLHQTYSLTRDG